MNFGNNRRRIRDAQMHTPPDHTTSTLLILAKPLVEAIEILAENGGKFLVSWAGIDPAIGKQWEPTWVHHSMN